MKQTHLQIKRVKHIYLLESCYVFIGCQIYLRFLSFQIIGAQLFVAIMLKKKSYIKIHDFLVMCVYFFYTLISCIFLF